jgi:hypothetical protein
MSTPITRYSELVVPFILAGVGMGLFFAANQAQSDSAPRPEDIARTSAAERRPCAVVTMICRGTAGGLPGRYVEGSAIVSRSCVALLSVVALEWSEISCRLSELPPRDGTLHCSAAHG